MVLLVSCVFVVLPSGFLVFRTVWFPFVTEGALFFSDDHRACSFRDDHSYFGGFSLFVLISNVPSPQPAIAIKNAAVSENFMS